MSLHELDLKIKDVEKEARVAPNLPAKLELQKQLRTLKSRDIEKKKDELLDIISKRLDQKIAKKNFNRSNGG